MEIGTAVHRRIKEWELGVGVLGMGIIPVTL
jgi:hypothetical protein